MIGADDMNRRFSHFPPTPEKIPVFVAIRSQAHDLAQFIDQSVPDGREKSLAITALEKTVMWANAGLARSLVSTIQTAPAAGTLPAASPRSLLCITCGRGVTLPHQEWCARVKAANRAMNESTDVDQAEINHVRHFRKPARSL